MILQGKIWKWGESNMIFLSKSFRIISKWYKDGLKCWNWSFCCSVFILQHYWWLSLFELHFSVSSLSDQGVVLQLLFTGITETIIHLSWAISSERRPWDEGHHCQRGPSGGSSEDTMLLPSDVSEPRHPRNMGIISFRQGATQRLWVSWTDTENVLVLTGLSRAAT